MSDQHADQRLAAILAADVVGYSRLMEADERATVATLDACRAVFKERVAGHGGRVVDTAGDSVLAAFPSAIGAVEAAVAIQEALRGRNEALPEQERMRFRIGVNLGDVIEKKDGSIYGSGVNVAARLEGLAEPGSVMISEDVHRQVMGKLARDFEHAGSHAVKNVAEPVTAYRLTIENIGVAQASKQERLALPDKPSIAVLPFDNMSGNAEQEYFSDGISEDIITGLSQFRALFVIARNSTFVYKGSGVDVRQVAGELGVRYVLEGSVRKASNRVRITAQLIDAASGGHIWAERYDRELDDIFALQDEITERVVSAISPAVLDAEMQRALRRRPDSLAAHDWLLRGLWHLQKYKKPDNAEAQTLFRKAIEIDANFAQAHAWLANSLWRDVWLNWSTAPDESLQAAYDSAKRAVALDDRDEFGHVWLSYVCVYLGRHDAALAAARRAVELNPGNAYSYAALGAACFLGGGEHEEAILALDAALRLSPADPSRFVWFGGQAMSHYQLRRYEDAIEPARQSIQVRHGYIMGRALLTASLAQLERDQEADAQLAQIMHLKPDFSADSFAHLTWPDAERDHFLDGLHQAGLPE